MNSQHSRRMTNILGSTGQPTATFSQTSSQTSTLQKQMSKPSITLNANLQSGISQTISSHTRNQSNFGGSNHTGNNLITSSKTENKQFHQTNQSIGSVSNNSKISTNTGKTTHTKQGNKTPVNMSKFNQTAASASQSNSNITNIHQLQYSSTTSSVCIISNHLQISSPKTASTGSSTSILSTRNQSTQSSHNIFATTSSQNLKGNNKRQSTHNAQANSKENNNPTPISQNSKENSKSSQKYQQQHTMSKSQSTNVLITTKSNVTPNSNVSQNKAQRLIHQQQVQLTQHMQSPINTTQNPLDNPQIINLQNSAKNNKQQQQKQQLLQMQREADEFSFVAEHIEDEPSIHVKSITQFQSILKRPTLQKENNCFNNGNPVQQNVYDYNNTQYGNNLTTAQNNNYMSFPNNVNYETFEEDANHNSLINLNFNLLQSNSNQNSININSQNFFSQQKLVLNLLQQQHPQHQSQIQDETIQEPSAFFDEHNISHSVLHKCHMIEMYCIPGKPTRSDKIKSKKEEQCYTLLNQLISKVKHDVSQSIIMNQSKNYIIKNSNQNSRLYQQPQANITNHFCKQTDMTNESGFPNITHEELHFSMNKYNGNHNIQPNSNNLQNMNNIGSSGSSGGMMFGNLLDDSNSQFMVNVNNTTLGGNITHNTTVNNGLPQPQGQQSSELHKLHLLQTLQSLQYIKQVERPSDEEIAKKALSLPSPRQPQTQKKTLIFDLDETLIHCIDDLESEIPDTVLNITFPNGEIVQAGINVRPYALECLKEANKKYQVVVFTASHKFYADVVLDYLDPNHELIHHRLYRDSCFQTEDGVYIKDLRIIKNRTLKDMVIVDNAVYSFGFQLDNGIPIIPFYNNKEDEELLHLINYINTLAFFNDLREQNAKAFQLKELENAEITDYLEYFFGASVTQPNKPFVEPNQINGISQDSQAIKEDENESDNSYNLINNPRNQQQQQQHQQQLNHNDQSSGVIEDMQPPLETTSDLDQDEIQKCKKRLNFIEISGSVSQSQAATPDGKETGCNTGVIQTPAYLKSMSHSKNSSIHKGGHGHSQSIGNEIYNQKNNNRQQQQNKNAQINPYKRSGL